MPKTLEIATPRRFSFKATVYSHGWCELAPFSIDDKNWQLSYVIADGKGKATPVVISAGRAGLRIECANSAVASAKIERDTRHILRLDDDLSAFYDSIDGHEGLAWVAKKSAGRLLRSPTVFEDLVKTICTTN